jgi:type I restriction enzyme, S subunit
VTVPIRTTTLGECCEIVSGATPRTDEPRYWDGDLAWATPKDLSSLKGKAIAATERRITRAGLESCAATVLPPFSVLFSSRAPIGHVAINTVPMATNQGFKSFVPKPSELDPHFLYHWLRAHRAYLESLGNGATFKEVSKAVVSRIEISLPPLDQQRCIADILDKADGIRRKRKEAIALSDELLHSKFFELFGDIPAKRSRWPFVSLRPYLSAASGKSSKFVLSPTETRVPVYGGNGINGWATEALYDEPVVVVGRVGQQCGITHMTEGPAWVTDNAIVVSITDPDKLNPVYLTTALQHSPLRASVMRLDLPFINQSTILDFPLPLPPRTLQDEFSGIRSAVLRSQDRLVNAAEGADQLFASLVQQAFHGEELPGCLSG